MASGSIVKPSARRSLRGSSAGTTGRSLTTLSPCFRARRARHDDTGAAQLKVGRIEEHHLAQITIEHVEVQLQHCGMAVGIRDRHFQLDAVDVLQQAENLHDPLVGQLVWCGCLMVFLDAGARSRLTARPACLAVQSMPGDSLLQLLRPRNVGSSDQHNHRCKRERIGDGALWISECRPDRRDTPPPRPKRP